MTVYKLYCRLFQKAFDLGRLFWPWREPHVLQGPGCVKELPALLKSLGLQRVLLVTDKGLMAAGLPLALLRELEQSGIFCAVYDKTVQNPTTSNIEEACQRYLETRCQAIIAFGGGSPMDCAKLAGLHIAYPRENLQKQRGVLPARLRRLPKLFAVPTTAGTGSEATIAAVVTNPQTHRKYSVVSHKLRPSYAVLDPELTAGLPAPVAAATGMDALTHAVEAYIGRGNVGYTLRRARNAVQLIFQSLEKTVQNGGELQARTQMQQAAYDAGVAFTRAGVGYVHAIAHALGGLYDIPHGLACAIALPHVLDYYGESIHKRLAQLADAAGIVSEEQTNQAKANAFVAAIRGMNERLDIPQAFDCIKEEDIPKIAALALEEANPLYPVPVILNLEQCMALIECSMKI